MRDSPTARKKKEILSLVSKFDCYANAIELISLIGMSRARYYKWLAKAEECDLDDYSSCPKKVPTKLMLKEEEVIKDYLLDEANMHIPTTRLAVLAQRDGVVFCSPTTWLRKAKELGIMRPGKRVHPEKTAWIRPSLPFDP